MHTYSTITQKLRNASSVGLFSRGLGVAEGGNGSELIEVAAV